MFVGITNSPRDYAWGSDGEISALLGRAASGGPEAELWLGAHPGSPARVIDQTASGGAADLASWISADPGAALGDSTATRLPFLLKVLAAGAPLSLQAHPTAEQAAAGFERENTAGIPVDAPHRNYKDAHPKPELIYALSDRFDALCGFRPLAEAVAVLDRVSELADPAARPVFAAWRAMVVDASTLRPAFEWLISRGEGVDELLVALVETARANPGELGLVCELADAYPGDPGIAIALLLNHVTLSPGEALYLPAGNIHAYLRGLGVELMTSSDNVLRGGLTPKHIDVPELLSVLDFNPVDVPYLHGVETAPGVTRFAPTGVDFTLSRIDGDAELGIAGAAIALCTTGEFSIEGRSHATLLHRGESVFITPDEAQLRFRGAGTVFLATSS